MRLDLNDDEVAALRALAAAQDCSIEEMICDVIRTHLRAERSERLRRIADQELVRYADALQRLGE